MTDIFSIARREAGLCVALACLYLLGWFVSAYLVPADLMWGGWPLWFVLSCVFNPVAFVLLCALMVWQLFIPVELGVQDEP
ncbi:YhdT family protein [Zobellella maritima]|uniref:YhdT family protein n=1 Tax=Zobellella maritima TaxID=2059725 RepID=UPI000E307A9C|nr:YhdT family protein [Zobellella maritima]